MLTLPRMLQLRKFIAENLSDRKGFEPVTPTLARLSSANLPTCIFTTRCSAMGYFDLPQRTSINRNCQRCVRSLWSANHEILYHVHDSRDSEPPQIEPPGFIFEHARSMLSQHHAPADPSTISNDLHGWGHRLSDDTLHVHVWFMPNLTALSSGINVLRLRRDQSSCIRPGIARPMVARQFHTIAGCDSRLGRSNCVSGSWVQTASPDPL